MQCSTHSQFVLSHHVLAAATDQACNAQALSVFALRNIDMTKIESRPMSIDPLGPDPSMPSVAGRRLNNLFHIDFVANLAEQRAQNALRQLQVSSRAVENALLMLTQIICTLCWKACQQVSMCAVRPEADSAAGNCSIHAGPWVLSHVHRAQDGC